MRVTMAVDTIAAMRPSDSVPLRPNEEPGTCSGAGHAVGAAAVLTAALALPVLRAPSARLFGRDVLGRHHDPFTVIEQLRHGGFSLPYFQPITDGAGWLLARVVGPVAALNVLTLVSFPLSAGAAYLLARRALDSHVAALVAALLYAFSPFHVAHAAYHPHVAQTQWLPLYALALWRALEDARTSRLALLAAFAMLVALSNLYAGLIAGVLTIFVLAGVGLVDRHDVRKRRSLRRTSVVLACLGTLSIVAIARATPGGLVARHAFPPSDATFFSARGWSYLLPPAHHPVLGAWSRGVWERAGLSRSLVEQQVGLGWSVLTLATIAIVKGVRDRRPAAIAWMTGIGGLAFVASLPSAGWCLHLLAPTFRSFARFGVVVQLVAALLAGAGAAGLLRGRTAGRAWAAGLLLAGAAFEYAPGPPWLWRDVLPTSAHRWLAGRPGRVSVLDCVPPSVAEHSVPVLFGRPLAFAQPPLDDCAEPHLAAKLAARDFTHVIVRRDTPEGKWLETHGPGQGMTIAAAFPDAVVLAVASPGVPLVTELDGFDAREFSGRRTWRWMATEGRWTIENRAAAATRASLEAELFAFPTRRRVDVLLDGTRVALLDVGTDARRFTIGPMSFPSGKSVLVFQPRDPPVVAESVLRNGDPRALSIGLGRWEWRGGTEPLRLPHDRGQKVPVAPDKGRLAVEGDK
jgi:hypothetical protein